VPSKFERSAGKVRRRGMVKGKEEGPHNGEESIVTFGEKEEKNRESGEGDHWVEYTLIACHTPG